MEYAGEYRQVVTGALVVACTTALLWFGNGLDPLWPLMWFAMLPILWFALRSPWWSATAAAVVSMMLGGLNMFHYFYGVLRAPVAVWVVVYATVGVALALGVLLFRALVLRGAVWSGLLAVPAVWVSFEYVRNLTTPHGTAGSLAYSQLNFLPFLQVASLTGPWGMSFLLVLFSSGLAIGIHLWRTRRELAQRVVGVSAGVVVAALIFGAARLAQQQGKTVRVGLISSDAPAYATVTDEGAPTERLFHDYAVEAEKLAARGAQAIVLPEKLGVIVDPNIGNGDALFQSVADKTGTTIVVGSVHVAAPYTYNEARVYAPQVQVASYDKHHMLPPFESNLKPGTTLTLLARAKETWGVAICKDMDFTPLLRRYGTAGAGLMLVPAWDFGVDRSWHGHIAVMRGVEDGFSIARSAKGGYMTMSDYRGRILAEKRSNADRFATLIADLPVDHHGTLYQLLGDWFAWVSFALAAYALVRLIRLI
jgi:apolipoprotein N-acyltransferase